MSSAQRAGGESANRPRERAGGLRASSFPPLSLPHTHTHPSTSTSTSTSSEEVHYEAELSRFNATHNPGHVAATDQVRLELLKSEHFAARDTNHARMRRLRACQKVEPRVWESVCDLVVDNIK